MSEMQRNVWGVGGFRGDGPDDTKIAMKGTRASDTERQRAEGFLREMFADGRIDQKEFDGRITALHQATTDMQLAFLLSDLPGYELPKPKGFLERMSQPSPHTIAAIVFSIAFSMSVVFVPWVLLASNRNPLFTGLCALTTIFGISGVIGSLIWASRTYEWG